MRSAASLAVLLGVVALLFAQDSSEHLRRSEELFRQRGFEAANQYLQDALQKAEAAADRRGQAYLRFGLGTVLLHSGRYQTAAEELQQGLALAESLGDRSLAGKTLSALGEVKEATGDSGSARSLYRRALETLEAAGTPEDRIMTLKLAARAELDRQAAEKMIQLGLQLARQHDLKFHQALILQAGASVCQRHADLACALERLQRAAPLFEATGASLQLSEIFTGLGRVYHDHRQYERALESFFRALPVQEQMGDWQSATGTRQAIGVTYSQLGKRRESVEQFELALKLARRVGSPLLITRQLGALGFGYLQLGEYARVVEVLEEVLRSGVEEPPPLYWCLGSAYFHMGRFAEAEKAAGKGVERARRSGRVWHLIYSLWWRAQARQRLGWLPAAIEDAEAALNVIEGVRRHLAPSDFMKRGFGGQYQQLLHFAIETMHASARPLRALEVAEQARARAFLDLLATRETEQASAGVTGEAAPMNELIFRGDEPALTSSVSTRPASAAEMIATASRLRSTLLSYWVSPEATFLWVIRPDAPVRCLRIEVSERRLQQLVARTGNRGEEDDRKAWLRLHQILIRPAWSLLPKTPEARLTIVPHGPLFQLSFAALPDKRGRYLIESHTLHYVPAMAVFDLAGPARRTGAGSRRYLLVADPVQPPGLANGKPLPPLPGSRREIEAAARTLPRGAAELLTGAEAREESVRAALAGRSVVHFATHAVLNAERPFESFLALSHGDQLTAGEIYGLRLEADLTVLSACRSASGKVSADGILGLTRAFFYAGTSSVMASLWDVADEPAALLVAEFYRRYQRSQDRSGALRGAQLRLLQDLRSGRVRVASRAGLVVLPEHPSLWAGFVLQGEP